jgi:hypothetical protein
MATMAKSLLDAAGQLLRKGVKRVSAKERQRRLDICRTCPHMESGACLGDRQAKSGGGLGHCRIFAHQNRTIFDHKNVLDLFN